MHDIKYIGAAGESLQLFMYAFILFDIVTYRVSLNDIQGRYENPVAYFRYNYSIKTNQLLDRVSFAKYWARCIFLEFWSFSSFLTLKKINCLTLFFTQLILF